jgi:hypothetical protein
MHFLLYVCLPRAEAPTSLLARKKACRYLDDEGFSLQLRLGGCCDCFCVGGRWSGQLTLLRLQHDHPRQLALFWRRQARLKKSKWEEKPAELFREMFPDRRDASPFNRKIKFYGESDDAKVLDEPLFRRLKAGFSEKVKYDSGEGKPNVIFTNGSDSEWPKTVEEAAKFWVVVVDYHD